MAKTGIYKRLVNGNLETFYFATIATAVDETANRKWLTAKQQADINTYLDPEKFNTKNKLVQLDDNAKIKADFIAETPSRNFLTESQKSKLINVNFDDYVKRDGTTGMLGNLPMNNKDILGVKNIKFHNGNGSFGYSIDHITVGVEGQTYRFYKNRLDLANSKITNLSDPSQPTDAVNKRWVEALVETGTKAVEAAVAATTGNITLSGLVTIDGVALKSGDRVLVKNQTTKTQNGIYIAKSGAWEKVVDDSKIGSLVFVTEGTVNNDSKWFSKVENEWTKFSQTDQLNYTGGLTRSGEYVRIANGGVTNTHLASGIDWYKLASSTVSDQTEDYVMHWGHINNYYENDMSLNEHLGTIYTMFRLVRGTDYSYTNNNQTIAGAYQLANTKNSTRVGTEASPNTAGWVEGDVYIQII